MWSVIEVLIAGAGPAGCVAAIVLAREGVRVLVVDRARFPREKLCGDILNPGALAILRRLGLNAPRELRSFQLDGMLVTGWRDVRVRGKYGGSNQGCVIARRELDAWLLAKAADAGAKVEEAVAVTSPLLDTKGSETIVRGAVLRMRDGRSLRLPASVTIGADGASSTLAFGLGLCRHPAYARRWAAGGYYENVEGTDTAFGEIHIRRGHYVGITCVPGGLVNAYLVTADNAGFDDPAALMDGILRSDRVLAGCFSRARLVGSVSTLGPLGVECHAAGMPGLLLAGDAAGFIDPMTGDGLCFAMHGGELAARAALGALEAGRSNGHVVLARLRTAAFARKWRFDRALRALIDRPIGIAVAGAGAIVAPSLLRRVIRIAGDVHPIATAPGYGDASGPPKG